MNNQVQSFLFDELAVRGVLLSLTEVWSQVHAHQDLRAESLQDLGMTVGAATLLTSQMKFNGSVVVQIDAPSNPTPALVAKCITRPQQAGYGICATARARGTDSDLQQHSNEDGRCTITFDPHDPDLQRYQSIVGLAPKQSIGHALQDYMNQSVQIATGIWLEVSTSQVRGLLLQQVADHGGSTVGEREENWARVMALAQTLKGSELMQLDNQTLLQRLFWQEQVRLFEPTPLYFYCQCSLQKVQQALQLIPREELAELLIEQGAIAVQCEFCGHDYRFTDLEQTDSAA